MDDAALRARQAREASPFLTAAQAAFYLGLGENTLRRLRRRGTGPFCRLHGGTWRYHIDDLDRWSGTQTPGGRHG